MSTTEHPAPAPLQGHLVRTICGPDPPSRRARSIRRGLLPGTGGRGRGGAGVDALADDSTSGGGKKLSRAPAILPPVAERALDAALNPFYAGRGRVQDEMSLANWPWLKVHIVIPFV